jgi:hypothetical protein
VADAGGPSPQVPTIQGSAWSALPEDKNLRALSKFHKIQERMELDVRYPREPPPSVRASGGHLLLCIVSSTSSETNTDVGTGIFGPPMGISHFIKPLRDGAVGQAHPVLIVLAEQLPSDWHAVAEDIHTYFVCGSPLSVVDLDRACFRDANAIAVGRCSQIPSEGAVSLKIADARNLGHHHHRGPVYKQGATSCDY